MAERTSDRPTGGTTGGTKGANDDPRRADESGEPAVAGRSHGQVIDPTGAPAGEPEGAAATGKSGGDPEPGDKGNAGTVGRDYESGRRDAL